MLLIGFLLQTNVQAQQDTVFIKNFNTGDYKASSYTYTGILGKDGFYYFANENGILKYDGSRWELIPIKDFNAVYSIAVDSAGRIYVGGFGEIGYIDYQDDQYKYTSLTPLIKTDRDFNEFWLIVQDGKDTYYSSYEGLFRFDGDSLHFIDKKQTQLFKVDGKLILAEFNGGMFLLENDSIIKITDGPRLKNDLAYAFVPTKDPDVYWMMTSENGVFHFNIKTYELRKLNKPFSHKLAKTGVYDAIVWRDSLYAVTTWYDGIKFIDYEGNIVKSINRSNGLQGNSLKELFQDQRGNIWTGSAYGIIYLSWPTDYTKSDYTPKTIISKINYKYTADSLVSSIEFNFATLGYDKSQLQYSYHLEGFDKDFSEWTDETKKEYTNLDGGNTHSM